MSESFLGGGVSRSPSAGWWLIADQIWTGPGRWLGRSALPMRGPGAAGGDPVMTGAIPPGAWTFELGATLVPGLQDAHVHSGLVDLSAVRSGGVAAALDLGGVPEQVGALRRESLDPASGLPVLEIVGAFLTAPGGYPSDRSWAAPGSWREVRSAADAAAAVAEQAVHGAAAVKVAINPDAGPVLEPSVLAAIVAAAHTAGLTVIAHAEGEGAVRTALSAGVDVLAHTPWTEPLQPDLLRECALQTTWISTLAIHRRDPDLSVAMDNLSGFLNSGGTVRYGTDLGNGPLPLGINAQEILALQTVGLAVDDVLAAMTGPMTTAPGGRTGGRTGGSAAGAPAAGPSRFVPGVAPCLLLNGLHPDEPVIGSALRQAQVFSLEGIREMERWQA